MTHTQDHHNDDLTARLDAIEASLRLAQDRWDLSQIIASYGPAVDSGSDQAAAKIWAEDGVYDTFPTVLTGRAALGGMVRGELHQELIHAGAAHLQGIPHIEISGDTAVVTHYSQLVLKNPDEDTFRIWRTGVNRWEFVRTGDGWLATRRLNRQLDGSAEARDLLAQAVTDAGGES